MSRPKSKTDNTVEVAVITAIAGIIVALIAALAPAVLKSLESTPTPMPTTAPSVAPTELSVVQEEPPSDDWIPSVYYATFGLGFPEGAWAEGETYTYSLQVQECERDNFTSQTISFSVGLFAGGPFYLLKDGLYDHPDKNIADPAQASSFQESYAMVIFPKATAEEAQRVLDSCQAFITVNSGPLVPLEPYYQGPIPGFGTVGNFNIDASSFPDSEIFP